jgi:3',5'-cyclic AMP phosphodiesterase CpdA
MKPLKIAQLSDFHFTRVTWNPLRLFSKRIVGQLNWLFCRKKNFSEERINALPPLLNNLGVDQVLLGGDFTSTSLQSEFEAAKKFAERLDVPWIAIPGNHDAYTLGSYLTGRYYRYFGTEGLKKNKVETHPLNSSWVLIALDVAVPGFASKGKFSSAQETFLKKTLDSIAPKQNIILFNHYPFFNNDFPSRGLKGKERLEAIVARDPRIKLYLHGHTHRHVIANLQPSGLPVVLDGGCVAHGEQGSWNLMTIDDKGIKIDVYRWAKHEWAVARSEEIAWTR